MAHNLKKMSKVVNELTEKNSKLSISSNSCCKELDEMDDPQPKLIKNCECEAVAINGPHKSSNLLGRSRKGRPKKPTNSNKYTCRARAKSHPSSKIHEQRNRLVTDYFPVRRSARVPSSKIEKQKQQEMEDALLNKKEVGLKVVDFGDKGRGVVATKYFKRGDFVVEYAGELIKLDEAKERETKYSMNEQIGCYMYYFIHQNKNYCVDATAESGRLGRLINHSKSAGNCATKVVSIGDRPYLILIAAQDINEGGELLYDYGDRSKESREAHPWLNL